MSVTITDRAKKQLVQSLKEENKSAETHHLRVGVLSGGCSGLQYFMEFGEMTDTLDGDKSFDLDTIQRSIKISKQDLGELKDNLFIALVLIMEKLPKVVYLIPSKDLTQSNSNIFIDNEVSLMPSLSNWEILIFLFLFLSRKKDNNKD